jgi:hypothetical protein
VSSIFFGQTQEPLFYGDGWDGVDQDASHARYCERLIERIEAAFPGVDVEVGTETDRRWADGFGEAMNESVVADCVIISEQLYQEPDEWVVEAFRPGDRVEAGEGDEHDTGIIRSVSGGEAEIGWDSGTITPAKLADLSLL